MLEIRYHINDINDIIMIKQKHELLNYKNKINVINDLLLITNLSNVTTSTTITDKKRDNEYANDVHRDRMYITMIIQ
jgi:hypothetical protein